MHASRRFDFGEFDAFADDIADLALDLLQHARKRRAQGLLHLHDFEGEDRARPSPASRPPRPAAPPRCPATAPRSCPRRPAPRSRRRTDRPNAGRSGRCGCADKAHGPRSRRRRAISRRRASGRSRRRPQATTRRRTRACRSTSVDGPLPYCSVTLLLGALPLRGTRIPAAAGRPASSRRSATANALRSRACASLVRGWPRPPRKARDRRRAGGLGVSAFNSRSMKPVSIVLARTSGCVTSADRNGMLVTMPRTSVSSSPRLSRSIAASRVGAQAITLASMAS